MELGLRLGDSSKLLEDSNIPNQQHKIKSSGLDFCIDLGLSSPAVKEGGEIPKFDDENDDDDDYGDGLSSGEDGSDDNRVESGTVVQLNLLPYVPVHRRQILSLPWSSDNGSSENGSAAKGVGVNKQPAAEEVSSANSVGMYAGNGSLQAAGNSNKRDLGNDVVEGDDDENALNTRKKLRLSKEQSAFLEESFKEHNTLNPKQKLALAKQLNLRPRQVEVWFQNRRARTKLKQTEVDCEFLKRCCETLTEENRRLQKEVQELRGLKSSNPFYLHHPATTLTMCPSCERVATPRPRFYPFLQTPTRPNPS